MPAYEYRCASCEQTITVSRGINEPEQTPACAKCAEPMNKIYGLTGITFKGTGWGKDAR